MLRILYKGCIFFFISLLIYIAVLMVITIGSNEANLVFVIYAAVVAAAFNALFVLLLAIAKIFNIYQFSLQKQVFEMGSYLLLLLIFEFIARKLHVAPSVKVFLDFPYSFIYPCVLMLIPILLLRKRY